MLEIKLKNTYKKLIHYFSIFTIILGTTFGSLNSSFADPAEVSLGNGLSSSLDNEIDNPLDTLVAAENAVTHEIFLDDGDVTAVSLTNATAGDLVLTITDDDADTAGTFTITGDIAATAADLTIKTDDNAVTLSFGGNMTEDGEAMLVQLDATGILNITGTAVNIDAKIDGIADGEGTFNVTGTATFDDAIGSVKEIAAMNVSGASTFVSTVDVEAVTVTAATTIAGALKADTVSVTDAVLTLNALAIDTDAGAETLVITLNDTASTGQVSFVSGAAVDITGTINGADDGEGKIVVAQGAGAPGNETTFKGAIGGLKRVGAIEVGSTSLSGLADFEAAVITDSLSVIGGDNALEDSQVDVGASITASSGGITLTPGAGDAKLLVTANSTLTGAIDKSGSGSGTAIIAVSGGTLTLSSNVGSSTAIDSFTLVDGTAAAINGDFSATTTLITDAATITYDKGSDQTHTGAITVAADDDGALVNANTDGELTFTAAIGTATNALTEITLNDGAKTNFNAAIFAKTLDIDTNGETTYFAVGGNEIGDTGANAGALQIVAGAVIELGTSIGNGTTVFDTQTVEATGDGVLIAGDITIKPSANFTSGTIILIQGDSAEISAAEKADILVQDTALTTFTVDDGGGTATHDIGITATAKSDATTASELSVTVNNAKSLRQAIESASTGSSSDSAALTALNDSLVVINGRSATDDTDLAKQVAPQDDMISGSTLASKAVTGTVQGIISNRMASLRSGDAYYGMGMSAGNMTAKSGFIQAFGSEVEQKNKTVGSGTQYGYESSSAGFALGFDGTTDTGATVGLSFSMSNTDLDGKGTGKAKNDIDSYTASLYWDKTGQNGYVEGSLTYGLNENKTSRLVNTAGLSRTYTGSYDSNQLSLSLGGGAPNAVGASGYVTPFIGVTGTYIKTDAYTESSTTAGDNLRLRVAQDDINSLVGKVGVKYHNVTDKGTPMISLSLNNEFGDDTINSTNTYQGGGSSFTTSTDVEPLSATLGLGYSYGSDTASIEFAYEAEANDDKYLGHYGSIKIVGKF